MGYMFGIHEEIEQTATKRDAGEIILVLFVVVFLSGYSVAFRHQCGRGSVLFPAIRCCYF